MRVPADYALLDAGDGRRLERFGEVVVDRPAPVTAGIRRRAPARWGSATARFERPGGWRILEPLPDPWLVRFDRLTLELAPTASGQLGVFPEQADSWRWLAERLATSSPGSRVLNLFAHTGASTLAAAAAGAEVVHVDSVRSALARARRNAGHSGLAAAAVHWVPEDAVRYVGREVRRGHRYQGLILDPPSFGRGPRGEAWRLIDRLPALLASCSRLLPDEGPAFLLLTAHTPELGAAKLRSAVAGALGFGTPAKRVGRLEALELTLAAESGARLAAGVAVRWWR